MAVPVLCNVGQWLDENSQFFLPPVCNKLMHDGQANVMFVGGPNNRKDYHIEGGEELFLQVKGDMVLKVVEQNKHRDISINEGEIFLLPRAIPHSPQRLSDTVGLVMERQRLKTEVDGLRFYVYDNNNTTPTTEPLFEAWFPWNENRERMSEFFDEYFASEQCKTGKPIPGTFPDKPPIVVDTATSLGNPFSLNDWIVNNRRQIDVVGKLAIFDLSRHQMQAFIYGRGENTDCAETADTWIWQKEGESSVKVGSETHTLKADDSLLVPIGHRFTVTQDDGSLSFVCYQVPLVD